LVAYFWYTPRKFGTEAMKRIVLKSPFEKGRNQLRSLMSGSGRSTYDVLMKWSSIQPRNECLDGKERGQDTTKHSDKSENDRDASRDADRLLNVPLQGGTAVADIVVSKFLDSESPVSPPTNRDLALDYLPVLNESGGPQDEGDRVISRVGGTEQPESTPDCRDDAECFGIGGEEVEVQAHLFSKLHKAPKSERVKKTLEGD
jgi:hypothetical protein